MNFFIYVIVFILGAAITFAVLATMRLPKNGVSDFDTLTIHQNWKPKNPPPDLRGHDIPEVRLRMMYEKLTGEQTKI